MNEDEDVVLNAKAIGLAVGGAALAGLLFVLTRRDERATSVTTEVDLEAVEDSQAREVAAEARRHRKTVEDALESQGEQGSNPVASPTVDPESVERDLKAAAWDAQERARLAESRLRAASSKVAVDSAQLASRVGAEARHLADKGKGRFSNLRRSDETVSEVERLKAELETLREELAGKSRSEGKDVLGVTKKLAGKKVGPLPEGVAGEAASAALLQLEKSLKTKAPLLLAARNKAQAMEIAQRELGPILRDTAMIALTTALGSAARTSQKAESAQQDIKDRFRQEVEPKGPGSTHDDLEERLRAAREEAEAEARIAREEAEAEARTARDEVDRLKAELEARLEEMKQSSASNGSHSVWSRHEDEAVPDQATVVTAELEIVADPAEYDDAEKKRGISGLLWGGAGLGLAIYAMMDSERRESVLKLANEASVQMQELVRDLQGYDDEF